MGHPEEWPNLGEWWGIKWDERPKTALPKTVRPAHNGERARRCAVRRRRLARGAVNRNQGNHAGCDPPPVNTLAIDNDMFRRIGFPW